MCITVDVVDLFSSKICSRLSYTHLWDVWNVSIEVYPKDTKNGPISSFVCVNNEAGEQGLHIYRWLGCVLLRYIASLETPICTRPNFYFSAPFSLLLVLLPAVIPFLWYCEAVGVQWLHHLHVFQFSVLLVHAGYLSLHISWYLSWL